MKEFKSQVTSLSAPVSTVYAFLGDFRHYNHVLPNEVQNWQAEQEWCSFEVPMIGEVRLKFKTREPETFIEIVPENKLPVDLNIQCRLFIEEDNPKAQIILLSDLGPSQGFLFSRILQNLADMMASRLGELSQDDFQH